MLTDELLEVPALLRRMAEAQARTDEQFASLAQRLDVLTEHASGIIYRTDPFRDRLDASAEEFLALCYERLACGRCSIATARRRGDDAYITG